MKYLMLVILTHLMFVNQAIASMGGAYIDCNDNFCKLSGYSKQEVCSMTIFNMTSRNDLQHAFDLISQMITPNIESPNQDESKSIILQGSVKSRNDLGLSISLIKGNQGIGRCFCVTLVRIISMDKSRPDVISVEMELPVIPNKNGDIGFGASPAYTSG
jgi:PAS domain S-box-containing protein